ncbi:hypothetical protein [Mesorhizobium sp. M0058]|uniref:hypothetical protein n=1 Tax=Mesorhizobium sp. M0058 TaxID=2956865 RepID=UPI00333DF2E1
MSLRSAKLQSELRHDQQVSAVGPRGVRTFDNSQSREAKRFPDIINTRHSKPPCTVGDHDAETVGGVRQGIRISRRVVVPSPVVREESMRNIAAELERAVKEAAGPIVPGMGIKAQINAACDNLGYPRGFWRVREAWYGEAKNWRGDAIFDLLGRYNLWCSKAGVQLTPANDPITILSKVGEQR